MIQNSYDDKAKLYLVPTPVGNMKDMTSRGIETLKMVDAVFSEDTRVTKVLFNMLDIQNTLYSCHKYNELQVFPKMLKLLNEGKSIALVSDRGTPLISDPGFYVVNECIKNNFSVVALPGASALLPALNMSNIRADKFLFYGFLSQSKGEKIKQLEDIKFLFFTIVIYESPHRLMSTLQLIKEIMGDLVISISREISKLYEEVFRGKISEALESYIDIKGEIVLIIDNNIVRDNLDTAYIELKELVEYNMNSKDALKFISKKYNVSKNLLYKLLEDDKNEINSRVR